MADLNVAVPDFFKGMEAMLKTVSMDDWKVYLTFHLIHGQASVLPTKFSEENFAFYGKYLTGAKEQRPRWKRCVSAVDGDLGEALGKAYVNRTFGAEGKQRTLDMITTHRSRHGSGSADSDLDDAGDEEEGAREAAWVAEQDRISGQVARLLRAEHRARRRHRNSLRSNAFEVNASCTRSASPWTATNGA